MEYGNRTLRPVVHLYGRQGENNWKAELNVSHFVRADAAFVKASSSKRKIVSMRDSLSFRMASKADIPGVLHLYSQPDLDDGQVLPVADAEFIFEQMSRYPNYRLYVAVAEGRVVGTFALLIMDNLGHLGAPSAIIEDVAVDPALQRRGIGRAVRPRAGGGKWMLQSDPVLESQARTGACVL